MAFVLYLCPFKLNIHAFSYERSRALHATGLLFPTPAPSPFPLQNETLWSRINIYKLLLECDCFDKLTQAGLALALLCALFSFEGFCRLPTKMPWVFPGHICQHVSSLTSEPERPGQLYPCIKHLSWWGVWRWGRLMPRAHVLKVPFLEPTVWFPTSHYQACSFLFFLQNVIFLVRFQISHCFCK